MKDDVIYYTKEDGKNIILSAGGTNAHGLMVLDHTEKRMKKFEKILGHPLTNLYVMINGKEFTFPHL